MVVLAEISYAMTWGWVDPAAVGASLVARPEHSSVFLTGRNIADEVLTTDCSRDFQ
ncbi:MAG: ATP:corrinoid adenosyltransferase [Thermoproteota archaeon]